MSTLGQMTGRIRHWVDNRRAERDRRATLSGMLQRSDDTLVDWGFERGDIEWALSLPFSCDAAAALAARTAQRRADVDASRRRRRRRFADEAPQAQTAPRNPLPGWLTSIAASASVATGQEPIRIARTDAALHPQWPAARHGSPRREGGAGTRRAA